MKRRRLVWLVASGVTLLLLILLIWGYPHFVAYVQKQDCIAAGYTSCVQ